MSLTARNRIMVLVRTRIAWLSLLALGATAQEPLTLKDAVRQALGHHPALEAATARVQASEARILCFSDSRSSATPSFRGGQYGRVAA